MTRILLLLLPAMLLLLTGCQEIPSDRLYALHLRAAPDETDWARALPRSTRWP